MLPPSPRISSTTAAHAALVTGARARMGREIAIALARQGAAVAIHHRDDETAARDVADEIIAFGGKAAVVQADLSIESDVRHLVTSASTALGRPLTLLVNNASRFIDDRIGTMSREVWDGHFEANLRAPIVLAETFASNAPANMDCQIINIIDQRVWKTNPQFFSYTLSKSALWTATRMLAQALAPAIRVNAIGPGPTLASIHQNGDGFSAEASATLLGRPVRTDEICSAILYLIGAGAVTGQMIAVDSGQHLAWRTPDVPPETE